MQSRIASLVLIVSALAGIPGLSQDHNIRFTQVLDAADISRYWLFDIYQDSQGFIWFESNNQVVYKYDGKTLKLLDGKDSPSGLGLFHIKYGDWLMNSGDGGLDSLFYFDFHSEEVVSNFPNRLSDFVACRGCFSRDTFGNFWWGSEASGLLKYDPENKSYTEITSDSGGLSSDSITRLFHDDKGRLWVGTADGGINLREADKTFRHYAFLGKKSQHSSAIRATSFEQGLGENIWIGSDEGLHLLSIQTGEFQRIPLNVENLPENPAIQGLFEDSRGKLWVNIYGIGIVLYDPETQTSQHFYEGNGLSHDNVWSRQDNTPVIVEDHHGRVWLATDGGGVDVFDPGNNTFRNFRHDPFDAESLRGNVIRDIFRDNNDRIWISTWGGISINDPNLKEFGQVKPIPGSEVSFTASLKFGGIEGREGHLWIPTFGDGLLRVDPGAGTVSQYRKEANNPNSLSSNELFKIADGPDGNYWITSRVGLVAGDVRDEHFINILNPDTGIITRIEHDSLHGANAILHDSRGRMWVGGRKGLFQFKDMSTPPDFYHWTSFKDKYGEPSLEYRGSMPYGMTEDGDGQIWITGPIGLMRFDPETFVLQQFPRDVEDPEGWVGVPYGTARDAQGNLWFGTSAWGLFLLPKEEQAKDRPKFQNFNTLNSNIPEDRVEDVEFDSEGNLWVATPKGISRFHPDSKHFTTYGRNDGMGIVPTSLTQARDGTIYIIGFNGVAFFKPEALKINPYAPPVRFTSISIKGQVLPVQGTEADTLSYPSPLSRSITFTDRLRLEYWQNDLTIEFAALNFTSPARNQYKYQLVGYDQEWKSTDAALAFASYTNLDHGDYTFRVIGSNNDGIWNEVGATLSIAITPPWWLTWWAYSLYSISLVGGFVGFYRWRVGIHKRRVAEVEQINEKLTQLDNLKDQFLANTSHELRTPLSGIIGIAESLKDGIAGKLPRKAMSNLGVIISSGKRLSTLVNDILDFSRLKNKDLVLQLRPVDMHSAVDIVFTLTEPIIGNKDLTLVNSVPNTAPLVLADENRVQQILHNLVGNAIKFTEKGTIRIDASADEGSLVIGVTDTGIGITDDKLNSIFLSFEQADGTTAREFGGTGLGLSVTRQLVELHGGKIEVESRLGQGSTFRFTLPVSVEKREELPDLAFAKGTEPIVSELEVDQEETTESQEIVGSSQDAARVLIVDDEPVNLQVLDNHLSLAGYDVIKATSGPEALDIIQADEPFDLIILDIMMPKMSGFEVCHELRNLYLPSELPVVMLTAKNRVTDLVEGFSVGANDYLTKPFSKDELLSRVKTHLNLHRIHRSTGKFVPFEFLRAVGRESITDVKLGDFSEKEVTIFFSDIRNFTALSEKRTPKENFLFINNYVGSVGPIVRENHGFINQYQGDGIMAVFPKNLDFALGAAVEMQIGVQAFNQKYNEDIVVGMGLHMGPLVLGIIGDKDRNEPATIADTVNAASRMENLTKHYGAGIIVSEQCVKSLKQKSDFDFRFLGEVQVKGKEETMKVFECVNGDTPRVMELKIKTLKLFEEGLRNFHGREFASASALFDKICKTNSADKVAHHFRTKAAEYTISGVPDDWDGVERMMVK